MVTPEEIYTSPNALAPHYSKFRVDKRLLLTGHSHQAWPDRAFKGQAQAYLDAAEHLDKKWDLAFYKADRVRRGFSSLLDDSDGYIALGANTHDLVIRFLSALPLRKRPRIITTDGEFHTLRRQLDRLGEEGVQIVKVPSNPTNDVAQRIIEALDSSAAAVMVSSVFYQNAGIVPNLGAVLDACAKVGAEMLVDVYHSLNVAPFSIKRDGLDGAFIVGGGYKYCQLGEGNCFLRFPRDCDMRPVITGWFSEIEDLSSRRKDDRVVYGRGASRFAGSTYDPTSHYRAAEVFEFFEEMDLTPDLLRRVSQHQIHLLAKLFDEMDADPRIIFRDRSAPLTETGGFLALQSSRAAELCRLLLERGVLVDFRGDVLRLGPAPYISDQQLIDSMLILREEIGLSS